MQKWSDLSHDPTSDTVLRARRETLLRARADHLVPDRGAYFIELVRGKNILDIGVVDHLAENATSPLWLHRRLRDAAAQCLGVDILADGIAHLQSLGFNAVCADITREPLDAQFDVITCGEVIEHLDRPGDLFRNAAAMLKPGGVFALSTPNPWFLNVLVKNFRDGTPFVDMADHAGWFEPGTICEIGARYGLTLRRFTGVSVTAPKTALARLVFAAQPLLIACGIRREVFAPTIIYEFTAA